VAWLRGRNVIGVTRWLCVRSQTGARLFRILDSIHGSVPVPQDKEQDMMRIGVWDFQDYAASKPISFAGDGSFITAADVAGTASLGLGSLHALPVEDQIKLTVERYKKEPAFKFSKIGVGTLTKGEVLDNVKKGTAIGRTVVNAEMAYCTELMSALAATGSPTWPKVEPVPPPDVPDWGPIKKCIWVKVPTRALFCENTTDAVTKPFAEYRIKTVHPAFKARGFAVISLTGTNDVRATFKAQAKNPLTVYISGIGHGSYTVYTGNLGDRILEACTYDPAEVAGKGIHFLSCQTGKTLGPDTVKKGARCYFGYTENFHLVWDVAGTPTNEFELFARSDSVIDLAMAAGRTAQEAYDAAVATYNAAMALVPGSAAASWLMWDRDHLVLHGDKKTVLPTHRLVKICFPIANLEQMDALAMAGEVTDKVPA
jgi:hypothetical protein